MSRQPPAAGIVCAAADDLSHLATRLALAGLLWFACTFVVAAGLPLPDGYLEYRVEAGETLAQIAARYGTSEQVLEVVNPAYAAGIPPGALLRIPQMSGEIVVLDDPSGLLDLALAHGLSPSALLAANGLEEMGLLHAGQQLFVPVAPRDQSDAVRRRAGAESGREALISQGRRYMARAPVLLREYAPPQAGYGWPLPVHGRISSLFGYRNISVGGNTYHGGVDLAVPPGTAILAAKSGTVVKAGWGGAYGYVVYVNHADGSQTRYGHMSLLLVAVGQAVGRGETLGLSGSTGASTGPHLHFEIRIKGRPVDPLTYLPDP